MAMVGAYAVAIAESDLATYRAAFNLPPCTTANGCFQKVNQSGQPQPLPGAAPSGTGWQTEVAIDLDAVSALCPNCKIALVEASTDANGNLAQAQFSAAHLTPAPQVITDSWGTVPASAANQQAANQQQQSLEHSASFTFPGIATVATSGDFGYLGVGQNR